MSDETKQKDLRTNFYIVFIILLITQSLTFSFVYLINLKKDYNQLSRQLFESTMEQKKKQLQLIVSEKIIEINEFEILMKTEYQKGAENWGRTIAYFIETRGLEIFSNNRIDWVPSEIWNYRILDKKTKKVYTNVPENRDTNINLNLDPVAYQTIVSDRFEVNVQVSPRHLYETFMSGVHKLVYATQLPQDGYVWVDQVLNYQGGDDYAIRLFHPNLPGTEGSYLSTTTEDIKGNQPYLNELKGIKAQGEVTHEYYFKKMNSDTIIRKLSYAKLIKRFNWIVATGVNLDDVDANFKKEQQKLEHSFEKKILWFSISLTLSVSLSLLLIILFEKRVSQIIQNYIRVNTEEHKKLTEAYDKMKNMAYMDTLTGLLNRRAMFEILESEISRFMRGNPGFCVILSDLDKFKKINDTYGHNMGDFILKETARILKKPLRREDLVSRWGGEEFLIFIPSSTLSEAVLIAEKLRKTVEGHPFQDGGENIRITMTFGVASFRENLELKNLIHEADQKLYKGKNGTRNCVVG